MERVVWERPFYNLIHFDRALGEMRPRQPKLLIVAPMSGHYATLLRGTVEAFLPSHEVFITDWIDARTVPLSEWSEDNPRRPACAIFIRDAERKSQASHDIVRKLFDLTPAETTLALALVNGSTLEEAADALDISKNTARSHLRAIFSKTGVTRQATLVRTLLNSVLSLG